MLQPLMMNLDYAKGSAASSGSPIAFRPSGAARIDSQQSGSPRVQSEVAGSPRIRFQADGRPVNA